MPMLIVLIGAAAEVIHRSIIGLLVGAVVSRFGYGLFKAWLKED